MRIAYFDCFAGVAGDMWVGALVDAGLPLAPLRAAIGSLRLPGVGIDAARCQRGGLAATRFRVRCPAEGHEPQRGLSEIRELLDRAELPAPVGERAAAVFESLARAEARVHGTDVELVHFHEVGAVDAIVDVVCACLGLHELGIERVLASAVEVGGGTVSCAHGVLPVPAPGALGNLLGVPVTRNAPGAERTTPTGAALLATLCCGFEPSLSWTPVAVGYGAGSREDPQLPNVLRVTLGDEEGDAADSVIEISCNLDTADGETLAWLVDGALQRGAVDAWVTPCVMKKGRPGHTLSALAPHQHRDPVVAFLLEESSSLGVRLRRVDRHRLERWTETRETSFGAVRFKVARLPSGDVVRRPEDDEIRRLCAETGLGRRSVRARLDVAPE